MKKIIIPTILAATILVGGMFAFMPVQKAATIHSTFGAGQQADFDDQERVFSWTGKIDGNAAINQNIIVPDNNVDLTGTLSVFVNSVTDGATAGAPTAQFQCVNSVPADVNVGGALSAVTTLVNAVALPADCEAIVFDYSEVGGAGDATDDLTLTVIVYIDSYPEV